MQARIIVGISCLKAGMNISEVAEKLGISDSSENSIVANWLSPMLHDPENNPEIGEFRFDLGIVDVKYILLFEREDRKPNNALKLTKIISK